MVSKSLARSGSLLSSHAASDSSWSLSRWIALAYVCIGVALFSVLGMSGWGVFHDLELVRVTLIQSETNRLRSHAARTVGIVQDQLRQSGGTPELMALRQSTFLRENWQRNVFPDESRLYAAITDMQGLVVVHSHPSQEGLSTGAAWYSQTLDVAGDDVVETNNQALTRGQRSYDVRVPIFVDQREIGTYHSGLSVDWVNQQLAEKQGPTQQRWMLILSVMFAVVLSAGVALFYITQRLTMVGEAVKLARVRRFAELGQLMSGIAHEIRNPLNAMRLNMHVLSRSLVSVPETQDGGSLDPDPQLIIRETNREVERVEELMRILLGYARPDETHDEDLDLVQEVQGTLNFLRPSLERADVITHLHLPSEPVLVHMDRDRLRQIMINLVNNAKEATGPGGRIDIQLGLHDGVADLVVADDGPGVPVSDREKIFEPFYTTKELGTGLGLALVRRYVEEAGGTIRADRNTPRGARMIIQFHTKPLTPAAA